MVGAAVVAVLATAALYFKIKSLDQRLALAQGDTIVSLELALAPARAASIINAWRSYQPDESKTEQALIPIARKSIHWDWAFMAAYLILMLTVSGALLLNKYYSPPVWASSLLLLLPPFVVVLDMIENIGLYFLLGSNPKGFLFTLATPIVGILASFKFFLLFLFLVTVWKSLKPNLKVLFLPRFSLLMLAVGGVCIFVPQWQEVLISISEENSFRLSSWLGVAALIASITTWYSARVLYMLKLSDTEDQMTVSGRMRVKLVNKLNDILKRAAQILKLSGSESLKVVANKTNVQSSKNIEVMLKPSNQKELDNLSLRTTSPRLKICYPRFLGSLIVPIIFIGLAKAVDWNFSRINGISILVLAVAWTLYGAFVFLRRPISKFLYKKVSNPRLIKNLDFLNMGVPNRDFGKYNGYRHLPWFTKRVLMVLGALNVVAFIAVWSDPLWVQGVGTAAVVIGAIGLMVPVGSFLVYIGIRRGVPALLLLFVLAGLFSLFNDNHWVRLSPEADSTDDSQLPVALPAESEIYTSLRAYAQAWAEERAKEAGDDNYIPAFIVSAEGGGIRAAYWTALVLASLQDRDSRFADHVFAISGVSGGSLGGAVFVSQVASRSLPPGSRSFREHADKVLQRDFLAPTLATLLFPDLLQRFLPWPWFNDRAITLEQSWENAWETTWGASKDDSSDPNRKRFAKPFESLWRQKINSPRVPLLFLNSTVVETGNRLIMHPLTFDNIAAGNEPQRLVETFSDVFGDAVDGRAALGSAVPLSTAVHLSARFTYVSPAGSIHNFASHNSSQPDRNRRWIRLVDGGYFENSGTVTARELLSALETYQKTAIQEAAETSNEFRLGQYEDPLQTERTKGLPPLARLRPFIIHISNEPICCESDQKKRQRGKQAALGEVLSPLWALLDTRPARGFQSRDSLFQYMNSQYDSHKAHFTLHKIKTSLPLGWVLSQSCRQHMQRQLGFAAEGELAAGPSLCNEGGNKGQLIGAAVNNCRELDRVKNHLNALPHTTAQKPPQADYPFAAVRHIN
jgi:hypothetical protein